MPDETQRFLLLAAAEPVGDPALLMRAAELVGLGVKAAAPAEAVGLIELAAQVRFQHPLVRSAIYRTAPLADRQAVHRALAEATDAQADPDRRTWHRAQAALGADEHLAAELERSAERAQARGGLAAAAAFLERAAALTPDRARRARRELAAAQSKYLAGSPQAALTLLESAASAPMDPLEIAMARATSRADRVAPQSQRRSRAGPPRCGAAARIVRSWTRARNAPGSPARGGRRRPARHRHAGRRHRGAHRAGGPWAAACLGRAPRWPRSQLHGRHPRRRSDPQARTGRLARRERGLRRGRALAMARVSRRGGRVRRRDLASAGQPIRADRPSERALSASCRSPSCTSR